MTETATLVAENLPQFCPTTNLYRCSDGRYLLVTVQTVDGADLFESATGVRIPVARSHVSAGAEVFLSDDAGVVLDADGDPSNGMTPIARVAGAASHETALQHLGYTVT